jgi:hypothetical protein
VATTTGTTATGGVTGNGGTGARWFVIALALLSLLLLLLTRLGIRLSHHRFRCCYCYLRPPRPRLEQDFGSPPHHQAADTFE